MIEAVIFDMDGVIVDNHHFHFKAWQEFAAEYGIPFTEEYYLTHINGRTMPDTLQQVFGREVTPEEVHYYGEKKESVYRSIYQPYIKPLDGLIDFLDQLKAQKIPLAVATSAPPENVPFTLDNTGTSEYFSTILDQTNVTKGKPDPEIYLKAAKALDMPPEKCLVFEDAQSGIKAAKNAGAHVIGLATTQPKHELSKYVDIVIDNFEDLSIDKINEWLKNI